jgi:hypothetical protein
MRGSGSKGFDQMSWWSSVLVKEWEGMGLWRETLGEAGLSSGAENYLGVARFAGRALVLRIEPRAC